MAICKKCGKPTADGMEYCAECSGALKADESYLDSLLSSVSANTENPLRAKARRPQTTATPVASRMHVRNAAPTPAQAPAPVPTQAPVKKIDTASYSILSDSNDDSFLDDLFDSPDLPDFPSAAAEEAVIATEGLVSADDDFFTPAEQVISSGNSLDDDGALDMLLGAQTPGTVSGGNAEDIPSREGSEDFSGLLQEEPSSDTVDGPGEMSEEDSLLADLLDSVGNDVPEEGPQPADDPIAALDEAFAIAEEGGEAGSGDVDFFGAPAVEPETETAEAEENGDAGIPAPDIEIPEPDEAPAEPAPEAEPAPDVEPDVPEPDAPEDTPGDGRIASAGDFETDESGETILIPSEIPSEDGAAKKSKVQVVEESGGEGGDEDILEFWNTLNSDAPEGAAASVVPDEQPQLSPEEQSEQDELAALLSGLPTVDAGESTEVEAPEEKKPKKKKKGFFARIFGNVKEDLSEEEIEQRKQEALDKLDRAEEAAQKAKAEKEEAKKKKAEEAAEAKKAKAAAAEEAKKKKEADKKEKANKKAELRKALVEEIEENEGRINKIGASFVFLVFGAVLAFIAIGTSVYTYRISIQQAQKDFDDDKYEEAYNDIYGIRVKEEDQELYDQIVVVNYVNTQLLAYLRYAGLGMDSEALDSLLKGLRRYEKYIYFAKELEVDEDMDFLKGQILEALSSKYGLSENDSYAIINNSTQESYSQAVRDVVENLKN